MQNPADSKESASSATIVEERKKPARVPKLTIDCSDACLQLAWNRSSGHNFRCPVKSGPKTRKDVQLFQEWVPRALSILSVYCEPIQRSTRNIDVSKHSIVIDVDLDYNQQNFRPTKPAKIVEKDPDPAVAATNGTAVDGKLVLQGMVRYRDFVVEIPIVMDSDSESKGGDASNKDFDTDFFEQEMFHEIRLDALFFQKWDPLERENRHASYHHIMYNDKFRDFVIQAFRFPCGRASLNPWENVLVLFVTFGFAPGQIERIDKYFVLPTCQMIDNLQKWYHLSMKKLQRLERRCWAKKNAELITVTVLLLAHSSRKVFVHHLPLSLFQMFQASELSVPSCEQKARDLFGQIQKEAVPPVRRF